MPDDNDLEGMCEVTSKYLKLLMRYDVVQGDVCKTLTKVMTRCLVKYDCTTALQIVKQKNDSKSVNYIHIYFHKHSFLSIIYKTIYTQVTITKQAYQKH
jgi:hypothetical protein